MDSSRIFVKNLPPHITEADFRKHFSQGRVVTDVKLIANRRIGFVGFKSPQDAASAVKYFHRSYIRMSRIAVDIAKPFLESSAPDSAHTGSQQEDRRTSTPRLTSVQNGSKDKKRKRDAVDEADPKLREFLDVMNPSSKKLRNQDAIGVDGATPEVQVPAAGEESDDEYEELPAKAPQGETERITVDAVPSPEEGSNKRQNLQDETRPEPSAANFPAETSDETWLRTRTNRLLDLVDPDDPALVVRSSGKSDAPALVVGPLTTSDAPEKSSAPEKKGKPDHTESVEAADDVPTEEDRIPDSENKDATVDLISKTRRLFVRNLPYTARENDLLEHLGKFGPIQELHLPVDGRGESKGFALVQFEKASDAIEAFRNVDGATFQGRIMHILAARAKREQKLDELALAKLPPKKQSLVRKKEAASNSFNWNALYMSQDAVNESISRRLGVSKSEFLDPSSSDAAVKQAMAESQLIQETKSYFAAHGVDLEAFKGQQRKSDKVILVKNFPYGTSMEELRKVFEEHGQVLRVLMPPSGTIAAIEMVDGKTAFSKLAYSRFKESVLFLEKAPQNIFKTSADPPTAGEKVVSLLERNDEGDGPETTSLYVGNLNFSTTTADLAEAFQPLDGFVSARVKTKSNAKKPGQTLSMGFGFVAFRTSAEALSALKVMDGHSLHGHALALKPSHRGLDAAEERRREDRAKKAQGQHTKLMVKNLPFESTRVDVRRLFSAYGQLRSVRVPKKFDHSSRGYAFVEFISPGEAENAMAALSDVHVLGRRLVLEWAAADEVDPEEEIRKMEGKVQKQVHKVTLQQLTGRGRPKVQMGEDEDEL